MLYSSSGGSRPRRVPREARRCEMARRPERRPSRAATKPTSTQTATATAMKTISWVMAQIDLPGRTQRHAPNMTGLGRAGRTVGRGAPLTAGLVRPLPGPRP